MKSGNLYFLEPSGPVQACNGIALPLRLLTSGNNAFEIIINLGAKYVYFGEDTNLK